MSHIEPHLAQRHLRECRNLLQQDLSEWIREIGPVIAEEVFSLANATRDNARQTEYLRLRIDLQNRWDTLTNAFDEQLEKQLQHMKVVSQAGTPPSDFDNLQLIEDHELTERIVMREFARRLAEACSEEIYALDRRIAHLTGSDLDQQSDHPFDPELICTAVAAGCEALLADIDARTLLLRQLERHLITELPQLYRAINEVLIEAGILPELKRSYRRAVPAGTLAAAADANNILATLQRLADVRQTGGTPLPAGAGNIAALPPGMQGMPAGTVPQATDMVAVSAAFLQSLQSLHTLPAATPGALTNVVRMARDSDAARQVPPLEAITLDIVATLFDLIFEDAKVPDAVKGMVSRLQIPILKVAMVDKQFFADRSHPARRFLDSVSGIAIRWGSDVDEGDPFYQKLSELVARIQDTFDQDVEVFATTITELAAFVTERETLEADTSRVVAEAAQRKEDERAAQRERQQQARLAAEQAIAPLLSDALPRPISQFLRGHWRAVLQKHALTPGVESELFRAAERTATDLVWSIAPKSDADERRRLVTLLPKLLPQLHQGLDQIGSTPEARRPLLDALMALHSAALHANVEAQQAVPELEETPPPPPPEPVLQVNHVVENGISVEEITLPEGSPAKEEDTQERATLRRVKHLVRGDWVEFLNDHDEVRRERLTWISPGRTLYLFSNHANQCAISITPEALAHRLKSDTARLVERDAPMFERALDGAIKALDKAA